MCLCSGEAIWVAGVGQGPDWKLVLLWLYVLSGETRFAIHDDHVWRRGRMLWSATSVWNVVLKFHRAFLLVSLSKVDAQKGDNMKMSVSMGPEQTFEKHSDLYVAFIIVLKLICWLNTFPIGAVQNFCSRTSLAVSFITIPYLQASSCLVLLTNNSSNI